MQRAITIFRKLWGVLLLLICLMFCFGAQAEILTLPGDLTIIETEAFYGTTSVDRVVLQDGVREIGSKAFANSTVTEIVLPASLTEIADDAFEGCESITAVAAEGTYAYDYCNAHEIPISVRLNISSVACDQEGTVTGEPVVWTVGVTGGSEPLTYQWEIRWGNVLEYIGLFDTAELEYAPMRIGNYTATVKVTDANGDTMAAVSASLPTEVHPVTDPEDFTYTVLNGVYCKITGYKGTDRSLVLPTHSPDGHIVQRVEDSAFKNKALISVVFSDTVETIGNNVLQNNASLLSVVCGEAMTNIGAYTFDGCKKLYSFTCSENIQTIGTSAFSNCFMLEYVSLNESLKTINSYAFQNCVRLSSIHLPDSITRLDNKVFNGCAKLTTVNYPLNWTTKGSSNSSGDYSYYSPFYNCASLTEIEVPEGVTIIPENAFRCMSSLRLITLPSTLKTIGINAFREAVNLKEITLPEGLQSIQESAFHQCTSLSVVKFPSTLVDLGSSAFMNCTNMERLNASRCENLETVSQFAFDGCTNLEKVLLPEGLKTINHNFPVF